jgi:lipopolysaccharide/colanic/teichoic acid biosynthesis glycosyltransferase
LDICCILAALPALVPLMLLIALAIRFASPGPIFFIQKRIGYKGRPFNFLKFRSMHVNADTGMHRQYVNQLIRSGAPMVKLDDRQDPRLFAAGRILRATGLDELPQLINVLRGEMSLVGPRPCIPYEFDDYASWHKRRCEGLPGLTGMWQVEGKNRTTFEEMVWLDLLYLSRRSLWLDLSIIARTIPALVAQARKSREAKRVSTSDERSDCAGKKPEALLQTAQW